MKPNRHIIVMSDRQEEMLNELVEKIGETKPAIIRMALHYFHQKEKPEYVQTRQKQQEIKDKQLDLAGQGKITSNREIKRELAALALCQSFGGKIEDGYCIYNRYEGLFTKFRISEEKVPLSHLDGYKQYYPSKEEYLDWCKKNNKDPYEN